MTYPRAFQSAWNSLRKRDGESSMGSRKRRRRSKRTTRLTLYQGAQGMTLYQGAHSDPQSRGSRGDPQSRGSRDDPYRGFTYRSHLNYVCTRITSPLSENRGASRPCCNCKELNRMGEILLISRRYTCAFFFPRAAAYRSRSSTKLKKERSARGSVIDTSISSSL